MSITVFSAKKYAVQQLANTDNPDFEAEQLLMHVLKLTKQQLFLKRQNNISHKQFSNLKKLLKKRRSGVPLQYILGKWEFYGLPFCVGRGVLVPRPDTEMLVDSVAESISDKDCTVFDLCAGSGAIGITIASLRPKARVVMVEKSRSAFKYLNRNILLNNVDCKALKKNIFNWSPDFLADIVVSNPPYIRSRTISSLSREVRCEPRAALDGGSDGLKFYSFICKNAEKFLKPGGKLFFEIGYDQAESVKNIMKTNGFEDIDTIKDYSGSQRVVFGSLTKERK